jgi:hypothetical protein
MNNSNITADKLSTTIDELDEDLRPHWAFGGTLPREFEPDFSSVCGGPPSDPEEMQILARAEHMFWFKRVTERAAAAGACLRYLGLIVARRPDIYVLWRLHDDYGAEDRSHINDAIEAEHLEQLGYFSVHHGCLTWPDHRHWQDSTSIIEPPVPLVAGYPHVVRKVLP